MYIRFLPEWSWAEIKCTNHKKERKDAAATASYYSYPQDSNPRAAYKKLQKKMLTTFNISVLKVVYWVVLFFSISNFFINKNSQGRKLSAKKIPTC